MHTFWSTLKDPVTTICAMVGAGLGIFNYVQSLRQRRVRLKVIPKSAVQEAGRTTLSDKRALPGGIPAIEVINLSSFAVTVAEAGFSLKGENSRMKVGATALDGKAWPRRPESREAVTVCFSPDDSFPKNLHMAYATTACHKKRYGDSLALKKFRAHLQETSQ